MAPIPSPWGHTEPAWPWFLSTTRTPYSRRWTTPNDNGSGWPPAITLLCLCLWVALHFGFAARLARLTRAVRDYGDGKGQQPGENFRRR
ncbi:MAG: hypothetical protein WDN28_07960 [Chthoniobacter sp.]